MRRAAVSILALLLCAALAPNAQAARPPVVVVVFDELPTTSLLGKGRRVDAARYPNFAALARHSTWFRNATTVADSTFSAIPSILDGRLHNWKVGNPVKPPRRALWHLLARRGYRARVSVEARSCPRRFCGAPRTTRYYLIRRRAARLSAFIDSIGPARGPVFYFKHTLLPHVPWIYLPSGRQYLRGPSAPLAGLNSERGAHERWLVRLAYQRHLLQLEAVDSLLGRLLRRLRSTGMYDRALLVITADHGVSFRLGELDRRTLTPANIQGVAPVPLFVKRPRQRRGRVSRAYARTVDVLPTVADVLNVRVPWRISGRSAFSRAVRRRRTIRMSGRSPGSPVVKISTRSFQARWSRAIRYQHWLFGFGGRGPGVFGVGARRRLIGRTVASLRPAGPGRLRARILRAGELRRVVASSYFRPCLISGRIGGGRRGARREIAIAVNGRVAATARSFRLRGGPGESFAVMVPEASFVPGRNRVDVLTLGRRGKHLRVRRIGRV